MHLYKPYSLLYAALPNHLREHWSGIITHWNTEMGLLLMYHSHSLTHCCWLNLPTLLCVCTCTEMVWDWTAMGYGEIARDRLVYIRSGAEVDPSIWHRSWFLRVPQMDESFHLWVTVLPAFCGLMGELRSEGLIAVWWCCCEGVWVFVTGISASGITHHFVMFVCPSEVLCWLVVMLELDPTVTLSLYWFKTFKSSSAEGRLSQLTVTQLGVSIDPG